jgi:uncharacterized membrane protein
MKENAQPKKEKTALECLYEEIERRNRTDPIWELIYLIMLIVGVGLCFWGLILVDFMGYHAK